ncbi:AbiV family abortive infection protein [Azospirillum sp.]|uniref:AbiV family abortive infection protein n=1 Tax=Azospirillum sp. TaxID=34012 RepID=UPI003D70D40D
MPAGLSHYRGSLTSKELADGINAARRNAHRLATDAKLMLSLKRYPSAALMAVLAIEEAGKVSILRALPFARTDEELQAVWRDYHRHRAKNGAWLVLDSLKRTGGRFSDVVTAADQNSEHTALLDTVKKLALYTECVSKGAWSSPDEVITPEVAVELVRVAELLSQIKEVTEREIDLWIEHLGPVWNTPAMASALVSWAAAMERAGLVAPAPDDLQRILSGRETLAGLLQRSRAG